MYKVRIVNWRETRINENGDEIEVEVDSCVLIQNLVRTIPPQRLPTGVEAFEVMRSLSLALKNAKGKEYLRLEDNIYNFLTKNCLTQIPAVWGLMDDVSHAIEEFRAAEKYDPNLEEESEED